MNLLKNPAISLSRVTGMFFIVLCHIINYYSFIPGYHILPQFFNCGIFLFIFISGYLYGGKIIKHFGQWYLARFSTVSLPAIVVSFFTIISLLIAGETISVASVIAYLTDTEGLLFLSWRFLGKLFSEIPSLGPLWFTTIIMLCYLLVPILQRITIKIRNIRLFTVLLLIFGAIISIILSSYFETIYFWVFAVAYCLGKIKILDYITNKNFIIYTSLFFVVLILRLILRQFFDTTSFYLSYVSLSQCIVGIWFVVLFAYINKLNHSVLSKVASYKIVQIFDQYSFYIYLVHGILCMGFFNVYTHTFWPLATLLFVVGTVIIAFVTKQLCEWIRKSFIKVH